MNPQYRPEHGSWGDEGGEVSVEASIDGLFYLMDTESGHWLPLYISLCRTIRTLGHRAALDNALDRECNVQRFTA